MTSLNINVLFFLFLSSVAIKANAQTPSSSKASAPVQIDKSLKYVQKLEPRVFPGDQYGFVTEDIQKVLPALISSNYTTVPAGKNQYRTVKTQKVDMQKLIPFLVGSIKEQQAEIEALKRELEQLKQTQKEVSK